MLSPGQGNLVNKDVIAITIVFFTKTSEILFRVEELQLRLQFTFLDNQRWSPRGRSWPRGRPPGHILKSLALASRPQVLKNCPVLGSRTALFLNC